MMHSQSVRVKDIAHQAVFQPGDFGMQTVWPSWAMSKMKVTTLPLRHGSSKISNEPSCGHPECTYPLRALTENKSTCHRLWWISRVALLPVFWEQDNESKELSTSVGMESYRCFMDRGPLVELRPGALYWVNPSLKTEHHGAVSLRRVLSDHSHLLQSGLTLMGTSNPIAT